MESIPNHITHFQLTSTERLKAEAIQHYKLFIQASAYYALAKKNIDRNNCNFDNISTARNTAGIDFISEGEALRGGL